MASKFRGPDFEFFKGLSCGQWIGRETESASLPSSCPSPVHCSAVIKHMYSEGTMPSKHCTISNLKYAVRSICATKSTSSSGNTEYSSKDGLSEVI